MEGIFMKKDYGKFEIFSIAACFIAAAMFVFSVFFSYKSAENVSHRIILSDFQVPSVPGYLLQGLRLAGGVQRRRRAEGDHRLDQRRP